LVGHSKIAIKAVVSPYLSKSSQAGEKQSSNDSDKFEYYVSGKTVWENDGAYQVIGYYNQLSGPHLITAGYSAGQTPVCLNLVKLKAENVLDFDILRLGSEKDDGEEDERPRRFKQLSEDGTIGQNVPVNLDSTNAGLNAKDQVV
jgi:hypothetical protein